MRELMVIVENVNGVLVTTSDRVAKELGVEHKNLLVKIDEYIGKFNSAELSAQFYIPHNYKDRSGKSNRNYLITKKGVAQLIGGYNSAVPKAFELNVKYINEFERMENYIRNQQARPLTPAEQLLAQAQLMVDMENRLNTIEKNTARLENNLRRTITSDYFTVIGYANFRGINANTYNSSVIGRKASKLCKDCGLAIGKVIDSKYGTINTYPLDVLDEIFALIN
jgi:phage regulatory protein, rha family